MASRSDEELRRWLEELDEDAARRPGRHALRLAVLAAVGYLYPGLVLGATAALAGVALWLLPSAAQNDAIIGWLVLAGVSVWVLWSVVQACTGTFGEPAGQKLGPGEAPALRALVEEVRSAVGGVRVDEIRLMTQFNASVAQYPTRGLFGGHRNVLTLGLPLLLSLSAPELAAVLAHEFGHLAKGHGLLVRWIYRVQQSWQALGQNTSGKKSLSWWLLGWFLSRYPAYLERFTLAWRRGHEREADRLAAGARGGPACARTLMRVDFWTERMDREFWPDQVATAVGDSLPPGDVLHRMAVFVSGPPREEAIAAWAVRQAARRTNVWASHPALADRLGSIGEDRALTDRATLALACAPLAGNAAVELLAPDASRHVERASRLWKAEVAADWRQRHESVKSARRYLEGAVNTAAEEAPDERAWNLLELDLAGMPAAAGLSAVEAFVAEHPRHPRARFALGRRRLSWDDDRGVADVEAAMEADTDLRLAGLNMLLEHSRERGDDRAADLVAERLTRVLADASRARRVRQKLADSDVLLPHALTPAGLRRLHAVVARYPRVERAYLFRRRLPGDAEPHHVLAVSLNTGWLDDRGTTPVADSLALDLPLVGAVVVLGWTTGRLENRLEALAGARVVGGPPS